MAVDGIKLKIELLLKENLPLTKEMEALYLLAELRKLIDHEPGTIKPDYRNIKFYCDWSLHTRKSRNFQGLERVFDEIYQDCKSHIEHESSVVSAPRLVDFIYFDNLRIHLRVLFEAYSLPTEMIDDQSYWVSFCKRLLEILVDQPITNIPHAGLKEICVIGANDQSAGIRVYFSDPIHTEGDEARYYYQLGNAF
ncbi:MAG TPA: hypothetical protein VGF75_07570 [Candidatus Saccharimonadales bacterium]|jgi:hypothetical protein